MVITLCNLKTDSIENIKTIKIVLCPVHMINQALSLYFIIHLFFIQHFLCPVILSPCYASTLQPIQEADTSFINQHQVKTPPSS